MRSHVNRRQFLAHSVMASAAAGLTVRGSAAEAPTVNPAAPDSHVPRLPMGKLGPLSVSRLISGGNLISGWAHSRDLHYVPSLMRAYNTEAKVLETLALMEQQGINTIIADPAKKPMEVFSRHWRQGGRIQWIAEGHPDQADWKTNIKRSIDFGAKAVYVQGVIGDQWLKQGCLDLLGQCVGFIRSQGVPAGVGAHQIEVIVESEKRKFNPDFYVKTCHHHRYWSTRRPDQNAMVVDNPSDNYWDMDPARTVAVMSAVEKPWIAFKILAAGAIRPESGFKYAFENGADFICVGMFDFQVTQNVALATKLVAETETRERAWMA